MWGQPHLDAGAVHVYRVLENPHFHKILQGDETNYNLLTQFESSR
jgi:hypothetical protein